MYHIAQAIHTEIYEHPESQHIIITASGCYYYKCRL